MSSAGNIGGAAGAGIGYLVSGGNPMTAQMGQNIGQAAGEAVQPLLQEFSPAAVAQRKEFRKAKNRLKTGNYGLSEAERAREMAPAELALAQATAQAGDQIARQAAGGGLSGGAATDARRAAYMASMAARSQNAAMAQRSSDARAAAQYAADQARVDQQAGLARQFWKEDAAKEDVDWVSTFRRPEFNMALDMVTGANPAAAVPTATVPLTPPKKPLPTATGGPLPTSTEGPL